jgi:cytochrome b involved in lipid metabolism
MDLDTFSLVSTLAAQDASQDFEDVGHSSSAIKMLDQFYIGDLHPDDLSEKARAHLERKGSVEKAGDGGFFGRITKMLW